MFGLGFGEVLLVLIVALLVLGPEKLPKLAKTLGRGMREFRRAASEFQQGFNDIEQEATRAIDEKPKLDSVNSAQSNEVAAQPTNAASDDNPQNSENIK